MDSVVAGVRFGPSGLMTAADWTRDRLIQFDVPIPPGNRLYRARTLVETVNSRTLVLDLEDNVLVQRVTEAQWSILEQYIIARSLGRPGRELTDLHRWKLEEMLSGADTSDDDQNPLARNTQFELYVAAMLIMGDVQARLDEPDLRILYFGRDLGVAAKRVRSARQLQRRVDDAVDQLDRAQTSGFVAVNVDVLLKKTPGTQASEAALDERLDVLAGMESKLAVQDRVFGGIVFCRDCLWDFSGERPSAALSHSLRFRVYARADNDESEGRQFFQQMMNRINSRLPNL